MPGILLSTLYTHPIEKYCYFTREEFEKERKVNRFYQDHTSNFDLRQASVHGIWFWS